jgi:hypothetical protein
MDVSGEREEGHINLKKDTRYMSETQTWHQPDPGVDGYHVNNRQRGRVASYGFCYAQLHQVQTTFLHPEIAQSIKIKFGVVSDVQTNLSATILVQMFVST